MTTTYLIELRLNQQDMILFLNQNRMFECSIQAVPEEQRSAVAVDTDPPQQETNAVYKPKRGPRAPRAKRGSKVNDTIIAALKRGLASVPNLKEALEKAGMAPSSLSTGLAQLQKNGTIKRLDSGGYSLVDFDITEAAA